MYFQEGKTFFIPIFPVQRIPLSAPSCTSEIDCSCLGVVIVCFANIFVSQNDSVYLP